MKKKHLDLVINIVVSVGFVGLIFWQASVKESGLSSQIKVPLSPDNWTVTRVSDGDTIVVRQTNGQEMKVRFCGLDAPETKHGKDPGQPLGNESRMNLQKLIDEADGQVMVSIVERDRYGRSVAEVFTSVNAREKSLNEEQLTSGMAYLYKQYSKNCPNREVFARAEAIAQQKHIGVWGNPSLEKPWDYRKRMRNN